MTAETHARLTALFTEAIELGPEARARLLERLRSTDQSLVEQLVSLLAADARMDTSLDAGPTANLRAAATRLDALSIPGYRVLSVLGEGGMGTVYAAEQQSPRRPVAIKVLHVSAGSAIARFHTEAAIMARLDHPGIARVLEAGDAGGHPFLVMEHVQGDTLDRHAVRLPRAQRLELLIAICDAVHHAHEKGVIHRDLKPSNVIVRPDGRVAVLDFGVARLATADGASPGDTRAGELIGTPIYMSPEQAQLRADEVDARSDVYTLGVLLYELLCEQLPYEVRGLALPGVTAVICGRAPIALGDRDPTLRGDLDAITAKALRKDPAERYVSAAALAEDVRRYLRHLPISARPAGRLERVVRLSRRHPVLAAAVIAAIALVVTCAVVFTWLWLEAQTARQTTEVARSRSDAAHTALESRTNELALRQARAALVTDPTDALAWLATMGRSEADVEVAWAIADEAIGRGVAHDVSHVHHDAVRWIEPLPASDSFVTGGYDGRVMKWDPPEFRPRQLFQSSDGRIQVVLPSPTGAAIAIGGDGGALHVISGDGLLINKLAGPTGKVERLAWSTSGDLASGDTSGNVWLWRHGREPGKHMQATPAVIGSVQFNASGDALVAGDHAGAVWLWDLGADKVAMAALDGEVIDTWTDGHRVVAVDARGTVHTLHAEDAALVVDRTVATGLATKRAVFSADGGSVVLGGVGGTATSVEGDAIATIATHRARVRAIALTPDGRWIATGSDDGMVQVLDRTNGRRWMLHGHHAELRHLAFGRGVLLSSDGEGVTRRWALSAIPPRVLNGDGTPIARMVASGDGKYLASVDVAGNVARWSIADGGHAALGRCDGHVTAIAIADGAVVTGTSEGDVTWWGDRELRRGVKGSVKVIAASRDRLAVATTAGPIAMFTETGEPRAGLAGNDGGTEAIAFSPDGSHLVAGGQDHVIRVWRRDGDAFVAVAPLASPSPDTHVVVFSPRGDQLFTGGNDGVVTGWSRTAGELDPTTHVALARHVGAVSALAVSQDGRFLASSGQDRAVLRVELATRASRSFELGAAASVLAFDATGAIHAVTRTGAVVMQTTHGIAIATDHGVRAGAVIGRELLAVAADDGAIVLRSLRPRTFEELAATIARATRHTR